MKLKDVPSIDQVRAGATELTSAYDAGLGLLAFGGRVAQADLQAGLTATAGDTVIDLPWDFSCQ